jgi:membrane-associated protease RseP (regulator of RpoE activity)
MVFSVCSIDGMAQTKEPVACIPAKPRKPIIPHYETVEVNSAVSPAVVQYTKGRIYVNNNLVATSKHPYNDNYTVWINYTAPPVVVPEPAKPIITNTPIALLGVYTNFCNGGAKIDHIIPCSPADKAGLREGDIITKVNSREINSTDALKQTITSHDIGDNVTISYMHYGERTTTYATLGEKEKVENNGACIKTKDTDGCARCY